MTMMHFATFNIRGIKEKKAKINLEYITENQIKTAISCLKNEKACGLESIKAEQINSAPAVFISVLNKLLNEIVNEQKPTENISDENLIFLQKPNKPKENIQNLRPIILLSTIRKPLSTIALRRVRNDVDAYLLASQSAYRQGRSRNIV